MASKIDFTIAPPTIVLREIGERMAASRLQQNITQEELAEKSGVAVRTLRRFEAGNGGSLETLVRLLQALDQADSLNLILPRAGISPMQAIKSPGKRVSKDKSRQRARKKSVKPIPAWSWDEQETP